MAVKQRTKVGATILVFYRLPEHQCKLCLRTFWQKSNSSTQTYLQKGYLLFPNQTPPQTCLIFASFSDTEVCRTVQNSGSIDSWGQEDRLRYVSPKGRSHSAKAEVRSCTHEILDPSILTSLCTLEFLKGRRSIGEANAVEGSKQDHKVRLGLWIFNRANHHSRHCSGCVYKRNCRNENQESPGPGGSGL